jgi:hypothetical protein
LSLLLLLLLPPALLLGGLLHLLHFACTAGNEWRLVDTLS